MKFDAIVLGSGQAGNPLVSGLANKGWSVALVEKSHLGGTCVNTGCTPTKTLVHRAQVAHYARNAARWAVNAGPVSVDLAKAVEQKNKVVESFRGGWQESFDKIPNLKLMHGIARFVGPHQVELAGQTLESDLIFINCGCYSTVPHISGIESVPYLTHESILELTVLPEHLLVIGGGYIGLEFGQMFARFGSKVTIIQSAPQIVPHEDPDIALELQKALESEGIEFLLNAETTAVFLRGNAIELALKGGPTLSGSHILIAAGRAPSTQQLELELAGIETDEKGFIRVNEKLETSVPGVYALGDIKGGPAFTHISYNDYQIVYGNLVEGKNLSTHERIVPYCVFTDPELGAVGMTEREARATGKKLKIGKVAMSQVSRAIERDETAGLMKIVIDASTDMVLGARILGSFGGEVVQILSTLILAKQPYTLLKQAIYIHPTLTEGLFRLIEDVQEI